MYVIQYTKHFYWEKSLNLGLSLKKGEKLMTRSIIVTFILFMFIGIAFGKNEKDRSRYWDGTIFKDVTEKSGIEHYGHGKCIPMADFDNDGDLDIYLGLVYTTNKFYQNEGNLRFVNITDPTGVGNQYDTHQRRTPVNKAW